jgi:hypothetical protein
MRCAFPRYATTNSQRDKSDPKALLLPFHAATK